jgi:hypothetical protein
MKLIHNSNDLLRDGAKKVYLLEKLSEQTIRILLDLNFRISNYDEQLCFMSYSGRYTTAAFWETESTLDSIFVVGWDEDGKPILQDHKEDEIEAKKSAENELPF